MVSVDCGAVESRFLRLASRDLQMNPGLVVLDLDSPFVPHRWKKNNTSSRTARGPGCIPWNSFLRPCTFPKLPVAKIQRRALQCPEFHQAPYKACPKLRFTPPVAGCSGRGLFGNFRCLNGTVWLAASFPVCLRGRSFRSNAGRTETILMPALQIPVCQSCAPSRNWALSPSHVVQTEPLRCCCVNCFGLYRFSASCSWLAFLSH